MKRTGLVLGAVVVILVGLYVSGAFSQKEGFEQKRAGVLSGLSLAIGDAVSEGKYECCIEPPCTMCYLGNWIWDDGICRCDEMILKGEDGNVCPQCVKGLEEGTCEFSKEVKEDCD